MEKSYNLLYEPWIYAVKSNGLIEKCGIKRLFEDAHNIVDIKSPDFGKVSFPIYEALVLRLISGIYSDAMALDGDGYYEEDKVNSLELDSFDIRDGSILGNYFSKYEKRFDLFGDTPFMQATDKDLVAFKEKKFDKTTVLKLNPLAIAADGRLFGAGLDNKRILLEMGDSGDPLIGLINSSLSFDKNSYKTAICSYYKLLPEELAYLLLYAHTYAPNVRMKGSLLCDIGYVQMMKGKDLKTTIVLNSCLVDGEKCAVPMWRWDSVMDGLNNIMNGVDSDKEFLSSLFFPSRVIRAYMSEDGYIRDIVLKSIFTKDDEKDLYDSFKNFHQQKLEPYLPKNLLSKDALKGEFSGSIIRKNSRPQWIRITEASCGNSLEMVKEKISTLEGIDEFLISPREFYRIISTGKGAVTKYGVRACIYYLVQNDKCKLQTSGKSESDISEEIFNNPKKTEVLEKICSLIRTSADSLSRHEREYLVSKKSSLINIFYYKCEAIVGLSLKNSNGYFFRIENAERNEELEAIYEDFRLELINIAQKVFRKIMDPNRMIDYFATEKQLVDSIRYYGKKRERKGKQNGRKEK